MRPPASWRASSGACCGGRYPARTSTCRLRPGESLVAPSRRSAGRHHLLRVVDRRVVEPDAAAPPAGAPRPWWREPGRHQQVEHRPAGSAAVMARQGLGRLAFLEGAARGLGRRLGRVAAVQQRGASVASTFFASLISAPRQRFQPGDLGQRQVGEQAQEAADIGVLGVAPELPVVVGRQPLGVEPDRALRGLAHLGARGGGDQRRGQAEQAACRRCAGPARRRRRCCPTGRSRPSAARTP